MVLVATGAFLRLVALDLGWFGIDQARDVATALDVAAGLDAPIVGPTMRRVVRLGAGYYYFWAAPYLASRDPLAGYWFAAALSLGAMLGVTAVARRLWGTSAALVTLAFAATHPVWVLDGRVAWAPAALPAVGALLLWLLLAPRAGVLSAPRAAAVGALLGLAVQLHLTMVAWVLAVALVALLERPPLRVVLAGGVGGLVVGLPAVVALLMGSEHDGGIGALAGADAIDVGARARAAFLLSWRVPTALSRWSDTAVGGVGLAAGAATMAVLAVCGLGRLVWHRGASRAARLVVALSMSGGGLVLLLPGEAWWYYLDGLLPVTALAAGAVMMPRVAGSGSGLDWLRGTAALAATAASVVLAVQLATFLSEIERHGYLAVEPGLLSLDTRPGADAAAPGRMLSVRWQRAFAEHVARSGGPFAATWQRLHGPALGDVASDNGFWLRWALTAGDRPRDTHEEAGTHFVVWYDDAPGVAALVENLESTAIGPLRVARYVPAIDYASCRGSDGPVAVPIRTVPHPKRYGDGRPERPRSLPTRLECTLRPGTGPVRVIAQLEGPGTASLSTADASSSAAADGSLCLDLDRTNGPGRFVIDISLPEQGGTALDVYDVPGTNCPLRRSR